MSIRTRTIMWHDPLEAARLSRELTGLEFLRGQREFIGTKLG